VPTPTSAPQQQPTVDDDIVLPSDALQREWAVQLAPAPAQTDPAAETITTSTLTTTVVVYPTLLPVSDQAAAPRTVPIGFVGIFFSTFFGGHGAAYTTPRDQYVWFKDFALVLDQ